MKEFKQIKPIPNVSQKKSNTPKKKKPIPLVSVPVSQDSPSSNMNLDISVSPKAIGINLDLSAAGSIGSISESAHTGITWLWFLEEHQAGLPFVYFLGGLQTNVSGLTLLAKKMGYKPVIIGLGVGTPNIVGGISYLFYLPEPNNSRL